MSEKLFIETSTTHAGEVGLYTARLKENHNLMGYGHSNEAAINNLLKILEKNEFSGNRDDYSIVDTHF